MANSKKTLLDRVLTPSEKCIELLFVRDDSWGLGTVWSAAGYGHWEANTCSSLDNLLQVWRKTSRFFSWHPLTPSPPNPSSSLFLPDSLAHRPHLPRMVCGLQMHPGLTYNTDLHNCHLKNHLCFFTLLYFRFFLSLCQSLSLEHSVKCLCFLNWCYLW